MIGPALYLWMLAQHPTPPPKIGWAATTPRSLTIRTTSDPARVVTMIPDGDGWIVVGASGAWAGVGRVDCGQGALAGVPNKVIVHREGSPQLTISLACPIEEPKP
jgi:hypothetical protein